MKVYLLIESRYDYCNFWETTLCIYSEKDKAEWDKLDLEDKNDDPQTSYFIQEWPINQEKL